MCVCVGWGVAGGGEGHPRNPLTCMLSFCPLSFHKGFWGCFFSGHFRRRGLKVVKTCFFLSLSVFLHPPFFPLLLHSVQKFTEQEVGFCQGKCAASPQRPLSLSSQHFLFCSVLHSYVSPRPSSSPAGGYFKNCFFYPYYETYSFFASNFNSDLCNSLP